MPKHKKILIIAAFILVVSLGLLAYFFIQEIQKYEFRVSFLDVGQGDATLIQFNNGEQMLVDCGKDRKILSRLGQTLPFYDRSIDYLLVTHPDLDHYGGCIDVLRNYTIKQIVLNGHRKQDLFYEKFEHAIKDQDRDESPTNNLYFDHKMAMSDPNEIKFFYLCHNLLTSAHRC
jgi:competence protein ComEC